VNIFEASSCVGVVGGTIAAPILGYSCFGVIGAIIGLPIGVVLGWVVPRFLVLGVFLIGIVYEEGPKGLRPLFGGKGEGNETK
jgi:hypothetical protein